MDRFVVSRSHGEAYHPDRRRALWLSTMLICCSLTAPAQKITQRGDTGAPFSTRATHLLGFANARNNSTGILSVQDDSLQFQQNGKPGAQVKIALVRDVFLGGESKQVGGLPMTLGKAAAPFGGAEASRVGGGTAPVARSRAAGGGSLAGDCGSREIGPPLRAAGSRGTSEPDLPPRAPCWWGEELRGRRRFLL